MNVTGSPIGRNELPDHGLAPNCRNRVGILLTFVDSQGKFDVVKGSKLAVVSTAAL